MLLEIKYVEKNASRAALSQITFFIYVNSMPDGLSRYVNLFVDIKKIILKKSHVMIVE